MRCVLLCVRLLLSVRGYPLELIEADLDLEADLGMTRSSVLRLWGDVGEVLGVDVKKLDFSQALSVSDIAEVLVGSQAPRLLMLRGRNPEHPTPNWTQSLSGVKKNPPELHIDTFLSRFGSSLLELSVQFSPVTLS